MGAALRTNRYIHNARVIPELIYPHLKKAIVATAPHELTRLCRPKRYAKIRVLSERTDEHNPG